MHIALTKLKERGGKEKKKRKRKKQEKKEKKKEKKKKAVWTAGALSKKRSVSCVSVGVHS